MFTDELILDGLTGFIFAAIETTSFVSQTMVSILTQRQDILSKVRQEFEDQVYKPAVATDPKLAELTRDEFLEKVVTMQVALELEYTTMVMQESLRI